MVRTGKRAQTIDLAKARQELAGLRMRPLDVDWLALDQAGHIAVFLGDDASPIPSRSDPEATAIALETIAQSVSERIAADTIALGYRGPAREVHHPVFDVPRAAPGEAMHEQPVEDYPHLVVATVDGAVVVRRLLDELGGREVHARERYAAVLDSVGFISYEELHGANVCAGCRAIDRKDDPRPRAPELLATAGLYVYGHSAAERGTWLRIASPGRPVNRNELAALAQRSPTFQECRSRFDDAPWLSLE